MMPIQTILHPTDFSDSSKHAFRLACALARDHDARLIVLHVAEPPMIIGGEGALILPAEVDIEPLRKELRQIKPDDAYLPVEHRLIEGDPTQEILAVAAETMCDLIVMGTHGRTGLKRLLMGSVAEHVVRKAPCPVLTVKTPAQRPAAARKTIAPRADADAPAAT